MPKHEWRETVFTYDHHGALTEDVRELTDRDVESARLLLKARNPKAPDSVFQSALDDLREKSKGRKGFECRVCRSKSLKGADGNCKRINVVRTVLED